MKYVILSIILIKIQKEIISFASLSAKFSTVQTKNMKLFVNQKIKILTVVTTNPSGYEDIFNDLFYYSEGNTSVTVTNTQGLIILLSVLVAFVVISFVVLFAFF